MHEWSLALSVVQTVDRWAREHNAEVKRVVLSVPVVSQLDLSILREAFDMLKMDSRLEKATLDVKVRSPRYRCRACGYVFGHEEVSSQIEALVGKYGEEYPLHLVPELLPAFVKCPRCGSHDIEADLAIQVEEIETI
ncbi:hydrogenase maturation nickel metallochaperone HypA [Pyrobaculum neutrophilum]|uniref:Hydrogenase maturation factor HypA n=1 Tax=Pyrobaculum neutrophilum (strain DSM 2338 / JCM 9278 / NBRC 100436 / V24Sta) TaxID=444157 RepID=B1YBX6_PYRNV|nr:hydrogenase maturation nickel metallochaperone HypA [Pyrobaculum neutrophilum]ACB39360.1 hydrogenase expression/synthesis HypA [Pyrobaculum neutrophilum V24Sta]